MIAKCRIKPLNAHLCFGTDLQVFQKGYQIGDTLVRPAMVAVAVAT